MSIIRPLAIHPRRALACLAAATAVGSLVPAAATAGPSTHRLVFRLSGPNHQDVLGAGAIMVRARCPAEACTVVASATSRHPSLHTARTRAQIAAGTAETLVLPLPPKQAAKLEAAFKAGETPIFTVKATARNAARTRVPLTIQVKPLKP